MFVIPDNFVNHMLIFHEEKGQQWLDRLPAIFSACQQRWNITILPPFGNLSFHYVAPAVCADGTLAVVKACSPTGEFLQEAEALRLFNGHGMVRLLAYDSADEVMLLERLRPGIMVKDVKDDEKATSYMASTMRRLWRPTPEQHSFPTVEQWGKGFERLHERYNGGSGPFPPKLLAEAESLYAELSASMGERVLLHGDLHQENVLSSELDGWVAIDPKGLIGEPAYEVGPMLHNSLPDLLEMHNPGKVLARRIDQLSEELGLDRTRVRGWGLAQAVLSVWWSVEDEGEMWEDALTCARLLAEIKR
jgi:streptomycin 6-kinase